MTILEQIELKAFPFTLQTIIILLEACEIGILLHTSAKSLRVGHKCVLYLKRTYRYSQL